MWCLRKNYRDHYPQWTGVIQEQRLSLDQIPPFSRLERLQQCLSLVVVRFGTTLACYISCHALTYTCDYFMYWTLPVNSSDHALTQAIQPLLHFHCFCMPGYCFPGLPIIEFWYLKMPNPHTLSYSFFPTQHIYKWAQYVLPLSLWSRELRFAGNICETLSCKSSPFTNSVTSSGGALLPQWTCFICATEPRCLAYSKYGLLIYFIWHIPA